MYVRAKAEGFPFSLGYHYASLQAANEIEAFRMRIEGGQPVCYDTVHLSTTISRPDGTFGFSFVPNVDDFQKFVDDSRTENRRVQAETGLPEVYTDLDVIYFTVLRGVAFTSVDHPYRHCHDNPGIPLIGFGEMYSQAGKRILPSSCHVHHALVDGRHVGQYFTRFQELLNQ
jgi:chloramphenicol O-acetyltransferase type A